MAVTLTSDQIGPTLWRFTFTSDLENPTFYIYINGELETETTNGTYDLTVPFDSQISFDVLDDPAEAPTEHYPPRYTLRWDGDPDAVMFRVEQYVAAAWQPRDTVLADDTRVFHYTSGMLADATVHQFRIVPIDNEGREGAPLELEAEMCRYPDAPDVAIAFDSGEFTIT